MKKGLLICALCIWAAASTFGQGIEFYHGTWEEAVALAKKENKIIFVDAYAKWCGPCKRMAATVFTDQTVGEFHNANFVNMKIDMEEGLGLTFRNDYPVSAYPTMMYIDPETGKVTKKQVGALPAEQLIEVGRQALGDSDQSGKYAKSWEAGDRTSEVALAYIQSLNKAGKSSLKIANEYLGTQKDLSRPENLRIIFEGTNEVDSRIFDLLIQQKSAIIALVGDDAVKSKIEAASKRTVQKAIDFRDEKLLKEAQIKMKAHCPDRAASFGPQMDMKYYQATNQPEMYVKACRAALRDAKGDAAKHYSIAEQLMRAFGGHPACIKEAERLAKIAAEKGDQCQYYMTYSDILEQNGKKQNAIEAAKKAVDLAREKSPALLPQAEQKLKALQGV